MIEKTCYFFNVGTTFDKNDLETLKDIWNCNPICCKPDLCNGLSCENYGVDFNRDKVIKYVKKYVKNGVNNTYGYIKNVRISLEEKIWNEIYNNLLNNYEFKSIEDARINGYFPSEYNEFIEEYTLNWEEPDLSFFKDKNKIKKNVIHVLKETGLNSETIEWVNKNLYYSKSEKDSEVSENEFENRLE